MDRAAARQSFRPAFSVSRCLAISLGDITGIGPEVALKALAAELKEDAASYLLIGDRAVLQRTNQQLKLGLELEPWGGRPAGQDGRVFVCSPLSPLPLDLPRGASLVAQASVAWLEEGARCCLRGEVDGLVTAPVNKEAIIRSGKVFTGQTELLSELAGAERTIMMLLGHDDRARWLRVALATTHLPLKNVAEQLTQAKVERAIELAAQACRDLGLPRARVGVCGLNPHAGEGGVLGTEEQTIIQPAIEAMRKKSLEVSNALPADTLFHYAFRGDYEVVVAMYHDQGLAPLKMVAFESGVNWTLGLPFIRTSPDHGTAYDIAGKGIANPSSMQAAIRLAKKLHRPRADSSLAQQC
jgi:4-hydroxythreonine-4-phosphate dehydrogenase